MTKTLGEVFPIEQARLRDLLVQYHEVGPPGAFASALIRDCLARADKAAYQRERSGDGLLSLAADRANRLIKEIASVLRLDQSAERAPMNRRTDSGVM